MIGGQDIGIPCADPEVALDLATRVVMRHWPGCLIQNGDTGEAMPSYAEWNFAAIRELLVNKTAEASRLWDQLGACEATNGTLVHLIANTNTLTVVVDDVPTSEMNSMLREIRRALIQDLFASRAMQEVA
jgi:hypothetical protein